MQERNTPSWDDLRLVLEVQRAGSLSAAARRLRIDPSTASRRLAALESQYQVRLFERAGSGSVPTAVTERLAELAEAAEAPLNEVAQVLAGVEASPAGTVRLALAEGLDDELVIPTLSAFWARHPAVRIELVAAPEVVSLARREADLALRFVRPEATSALVARRVGRISVSVWTRADTAPERLVDWELGRGSTEEQRWAARGLPEHRVALRVNRMAAKVAAVCAGLGAAALPDALARARGGLVRVPWTEEPPGCDLWLVAHRELLPIPRVRAVWDHLLAVIPAALEASDR